MYNRRAFLRDSLWTATGLACLPSAKAFAFGEAGSDVRRLTILHTNDVHSRLDPFPADAGRNAGKGGVAARAALIRQVRQEGNEVLLLDAGDIFQGTPYFNYYKGRPEIEAMSRMGYDACTMGNHDFDAGIENFAEQMAAAGRFQVVNCNYDFTGTAMESMNRPYQIFKKGKLKIGVTGVGIALKGLVPEHLSGNTIYRDPVQPLNEVAYTLKKEKKCDLVICLSHLGYKYNDNQVSDMVLARETEHVDVIIGGHTHTFMREPQWLENKAGRGVLVNQVGWGGIMLGRLDFEFQRGRKKNLGNSNTVIIDKKSSQ